MWKILTAASGFAGAAYGIAVALHTSCKREQCMHQAIDVVETACTYCLYGLLWPLTIPCWVMQQAHTPTQENGK